MSDLTGFLLARLAEDEADIRDARIGDDLPEWWMPDAWTRKRALAECEARRRIIELHRPPVAYTTRGGFEFVPDPEQSNQCRTCGFAEAWEIEENGPTYPCPTLLALAAVYADHPDFDPVWVVSGE